MLQSKNFFHFIYLFIYLIRFDLNSISILITRRLRRQLNPGELRRAARRPWKRCGKSIISTSSTANVLNNSNNVTSGFTNQINFV